MHINDNIRKIRQLRKLSQDQIADQLDVKRSTYAEWERETIPRADIFFNIADILNVDPRELLMDGWEPDGNSSRPGRIHEVKKISLSTIAGQLESLHRGQSAVLANVRAFGEYQVMRDVKNDEKARNAIMVQINNIVALNLGAIAKEGNPRGADR